MKRNTTTARICLTALFAALTCVATIVIRIPSPLGGYINFGDCFVILGAWFLGPAWGFAAGAVGSGLADLFSGYAAYVPGTFIIKGLMALAAAMLVKALPVKLSRIISAISAEIIMIIGYYLFEAFIIGYGAEASAVNIPYNAVQGVFGIIGAVLLYAAVSKIIKKTDV